MFEKLLNVQQLVALLKERVEANPDEAKAQLNAMLLQATSSLNPANLNPQQVMMIKAMAMAITETTDYLGLDLPPYTAPADIMVLNANFQKINDWAKILNAEQVGYSNPDLPGVINAKQALDSYNENKADKNIPNWIVLPILNGFTGWSGTGIKFTKFDNGDVEVHGTVLSGTAGVVGSLPVAVLPVGYRPKNAPYAVLSVSKTHASSQVRTGLIDPNGNIIISSEGASNPASAGAHFSARFLPEQ